MYKYISVDIETTGLDPSTCQIIEFAAVIDDFSTLKTKSIDELPSISFKIEHDLYKGQSYALWLNSGIFEEIINTNGVIVKEDQVIPLFSQFLDSFYGTDTINFTGKNFASFDLQFINKLANFSSLRRYHHRILDVGSLYFDPFKDKVLPDTKACIDRAGLEIPESNHRALDDAKIIIKLIREYYAKRNK